MTAVASPAPPSPGPTATETVFQTILGDIVRGVYPPRSRLPAERDLARALGASRPTLREALRRLTEWGLIDTRRGSGVAIRDQAAWSIEVLPAYLRYSSAARDGAKLVGLLRDLLSLRRTLLIEIIRTVADRVTPAKLAAARTAVDQAWAVRDDGAAFAAADFEVMRAVALAADFLPAVWLLNRLATVYLDIAGPLSGAIPPPADYRSSYRRFLARLEAGERDAAGQVMATYLEHHDRRLLAALEAMT
jgi:DNA-binding FadR family transcriptional regulator